MKFRILIKRLHFYFALIGLIPIIVLTFSGIILIYRESIESMIHSHYRGIEATEGQRLSISELKSHLEKALPENAISSVQIPDNPNLPYAFGVKEKDDRLTAYVDPYSGKFLGLRSSAKFSPENFIWWITELHMSFLVGRKGEIVAGISSLMLSFLAISGIILWWPRQNRFTRQKFVLKKSKRWKQTAWQLHPVIGFYVSTILLVVTLTGTYVTFWEPINKFVYAITSTSKPAHPAKQTPVAGMQYLSAEKAMEIASTVLKDRFQVDMRASHVEFATPDDTVMEVAFRGNPGKAWADEWHVELHAQTGEVIQTETPRQSSRVNTFLSWIGAVHFGSWGAVFGKTGEIFTLVLWTLALLAVFFLMISGLSMVKISQWRKLFSWRK